MRTAALLIALVLVPVSVAKWTPLASGVTARLRGVSAVNDRVAWASGANGTIVRTANGGATWRRLLIPGSEKLDFRDIDAVDEKTAYVLSIGPGDASRIYKTTDAGATWRQQFVNRDPKAFFDAMSFWDATRGIAVSDSVDGAFVVLTTSDGGRTWTRVPASAFPPALPNEGFFAASGTNVAVVRPNHVWIATGAASEARVLHSSDGGRTWSAAKTPLASGPSAGIFSIAFADADHGLVVGGDYKAEASAIDNAAITSDGGKSWTRIEGLSGFRSVVRYLSRDGRSAIAIGPTGSDYSSDGGRTWKPLGGPGFHTFSLAPGWRVGFAAGERGSIAKLTID
ncbi:MAG TPA: hypothetical protein VH740_17440 [Vicinamibacterales bacterium]|jgi:photosystem II stability/assembly factor-like uncharacterized protein